MPSLLPAVLRLGRDLSAAMQHLHSRGIVHCDLKPSNCLLDGEGWQQHMLCCAVLYSWAGLWTTLWFGHASTRLGCRCSFRLATRQLPEAA